MESNSNRDYFTKLNVDLHEYNMHNYIVHLNILNVPKIINYDSKTKIIQMEKISGMSVADFYGESFESVPNSIISQIRKIIQILKLNNIIYPDITGYNFILDSDSNIWIIDFEHAKFGFVQSQSDNFVDNFIEGTNGWNPEFK
jgi:tRNA A-37 threonylcarbamoyl transferase component Bud32